MCFFHCPDGIRKSIQFVITGLLIQQFLRLYRQLAAEDILYSGCCVSVHESVCQWLYTTTSLWTQCLTNCLWEFHQIYNFGAVRARDELISTGGEKVKGRGHDETKCGQKSLVERCTFAMETYQSSLKTTELLIVPPNIRWVDDAVHTNAETCLTV